ncbi:hypothetical protein FPSM_00183 [Flavobacterium psychrophilum]|nr:hypothetical protein FPSM_00183 [Flavobacterium psychrophilum]
MQSQIQRLKNNKKNSKTRQLQAYRNNTYLKTNLKKTKYYLYLF